MKNDKLLFYAKTFDAIPNAPFLYQATLDKILERLQALGLKDISAAASSKDGAYALDDYCLYVNFKRGETNLPLIIDSHIDHPGFVLNDQGYGIGFGSIGFERLKKLISTNQPEIDIFDNEGKFHCTKTITSFNYDVKPIIKLEDNVDVPNNSHGIWHLPDFREDADHIYMKNADNMVATTVAMALIDDIANSPDLYPDIDVTFIFTFLEEVFEVSATHVALKKRTPFGKITPKSSVIVLESMQSVPMHADDEILQNKLASENLKELRLEDDQVFYSPELREKILAEGSVNKIYEELDLKLPNHDDGLLVKINDTDTVYGIYYPDQENEIEDFILNILKTEKVPFQHTVSGGACNGTAYSLYPTTSSIITLNIPNRFKHNIGPDGSIVAEQIKKSDIDDAFFVVSKLLQTDSPEKSSQGLSKRLKNSNLAYNTEILRKLQIERSNVTWGAKLRIAHSKYFPDSLFEKLRFKIRGVAARIREKLGII